MNQQLPAHKATTALLHVAATLTGEPAPLLQLGNTLLQYPTVNNSRLGGVSELNNDGTPLQFCLSASTGGIKLRLIADPAAEYLQPSERLTASRTILKEILAQRKATALSGYCNTLFELVCGSCSDVEPTAFYRGVCWIGAAPDQPGVALYLDTHPLGIAGGWGTTAHWLQSTLPNATTALQVIEALRPYARTASIGLEGIAPGMGRAKFYFRLQQAVPLRQLNLPLLQDTRMAYFLTTVIGNRHMNIAGTVFSIGFDMATGQLEDVKIDLCGHCLPQAPAQWLHTIDALCETLELPKFPVHEALQSKQCEVAFLGMGITASASARLNLYLKPTATSVLETSITAQQQHAMQQAVTYLSYTQAADGSWGDYYLPVGMAVDWITAYTGYALALIGRQSGFEHALTLARKAATYLTTNRAYEKGWGYNAHTGADADSTAWALRLLRALNYPVQEKDEAFLLAHWQPNGGCATYTGPQHWGDAHPCVTPIAFAALAIEHQQQRLPTLQQYLLRTAPTNGQWPAYWWKNHLYSTYQHLELLTSLQLPEQHFYATTAPLQLPANASCFEHALAIGIQQHRGIDTTALQQQLLHQQLPDGRWPGGYNLRVTDPACATPWQTPKGELYCDYAGTITTATTLRILNAFL